MRRAYVESLLCAALGNVGERGQRRCPPEAYGSVEDIGLKQEQDSTELLSMRGQTLASSWNFFVPGGVGWLWSVQCLQLWAAGNRGKAIRSHDVVF